MEPVEIDKLILWSQGRLDRGDRRITVSSVSTDTRSLMPGACFIALEGERFDGHRFVHEAVRKGAKALVVGASQLESLGAFTEEPAIVAVPDTLAALQEIARGYRSGFHVPVVGVTGSNGKTTTKEMTAAVLENSRPVLATEKNYNNHIGLPLTLLGLEKRHGAVVVEMGMRGPGEIARLAEIAQPTIGIVTNIGPVHIERLGSLEGIAEAKAELIDALPKEGCAILNRDDPRVDRMSKRTKAKVITFGVDTSAHVRATDIASQGTAGTSFVLRWPQRSARVRLKTAGRHHVSNALAAAAVAWSLDLDIEGVAAALGSVQPGEMRMAVRSFPGQTKLIDDAYNASPASVKGALSVLAEEQGGRRVAVLGDMLEMGEWTESAHRDMGAYAARSGVDVLVAVGEAARDYIAGAQEVDPGCRQVIWYPDAEEASAAINEWAAPGDIFLIKGSRGIHLERVVDVLTRLFGGGITRNKKVEGRP